MLLKNPLRIIDLTLFQNQFGIHTTHHYLFSIINLKTLAMSKLYVSLLVMGLFLSYLVLSCTSNQSTETVGTAISKDSMIKRGSYLVNGMGCDHCHSPKVFGEHGPETDMTRRLSGHPAGSLELDVDSNIIKKGMIIFSGDLTTFVGPWGQSYAANLTNDETGIGNWTIENFRRAIKQGLFHGMEGSRTLLPPMPWDAFRNLNDDDLDAIFAFLKSTKPIKNIVPNAKPPLVVMGPPPGK
jgi:hypothetical protein